MSEEDAMRNKFQFYLLIMIIFTLFICCSEQPLDFHEFDKIDAHVHVNTENPAFLEIAKENNFRLLTINTDVPYFPDISVQEGYAIFQKARFPGIISYAATFKMQGWDEADWQQKTVASLEGSISKGAVSVKVWKNIGMEFKDKDNQFILIDNPKFDKIFTYLSKNNIPVTGHIGEPKNCWLPVEQMTVNNDKKYFSNHPEYHMFLHPEYPSYEDLIDSRDNMIEKNPDLKFIGCHLGSLEWSVDELAERLERFPNMAVDCSARMCHFQYQTVSDREKVRKFFIDYQDQLIYGTDQAIDGSENNEEMKENVYNKWISDWKYLSTDETMKVSQVNQEFQGLKLPRKVLQKFYHLNAEEWFPGILSNQN
jgi:predicted TIM-barrel fold metal-dependent hydrolase